jgi:hypothetical protein
MRRAFCSVIGTTILACPICCGGCGGGLQDTPDLSKGPTVGTAKLKKMEEMKALAKAAQAEGKGMPKVPGRR